MIICEHLLFLNKISSYVETHCCWFHAVQGTTTNSLNVAQRLKWGCENALSKFGMMSFTVPNSEVSRGILRPPSLEIVVLTYLRCLTPKIVVVERRRLAITTTHFWPQCRAIVQGLQKLAFVESEQSETSPFNSKLHTKATKDGLTKMFLSC